MGVCRLTHRPCRQRPGQVGRPPLANGQVRKIALVILGGPAHHVFDELPSRPARWSWWPRESVAERMRAAADGDRGVPLPQLASGHPLGGGRRRRTIDGRTTIVEHPIKGRSRVDQGAACGHTRQSSSARKTARNFGSSWQWLPRSRSSSRRDRAAGWQHRPGESMITPGIFVWHRLVRGEFLNNSLAQ